MAGCGFEPHVEPLVIPTSPVQSLGPATQPLLATQLAIAAAPPASETPRLLFGWRVPTANQIILSALASAATLALLLLPTLRRHSYGECLANGLLTIANGVGTLVLATGVGVELGVALIAVNIVAQVIQFLGDLADFQRGLISREHLNFNIMLNVIDAIPGLGVLSGIFGLLGTCVFDWAFEFGPTSPDRRH